MKTGCKTNTNRQGISLIVLLITIIVALIILSATTIKILDASDNATLASFAEELKSLEDSAKEYYLQNNDLPIVDLDSPKTKDDILALNSADQINEDRNKLSEEIDLNMDNTDSTIFYKLDLAKLNVSTTTRGVMAKGNEKDVYVIAYPSFRIYYIEGVETKKATFFSLSSKMSGINNININTSNDNNESVNTQSVAGLTVKKDTNNMANKMGIVITTTINNVNDEEIYVKLTNTSEKKLVINTIGFNSIRIDNENDLLLTSIEKESFNKLKADEKYMEVIKKKKDGGNWIEVARVKVDLSNYDNFCPVISTSPTIKKNSSNNILYFDVSDVPVINNIVVQNGVNSGVKEVRYEFIKKYNSETFQEENYYSNTNDFSDSYMKSEAKKAAISNSGTVKIELPKEVTKIKICVMDNAKNYTIYEQTTAGGINIGYSINSISNNYFDVDLKIYTDEIISNGNILVSSDGINYLGQKDFSDIPALSTQTVKFVYDNALSLDKFAYLKVILNKASGEQETKIIKIDLNM